MEILASTCTDPEGGQGVRTSLLENNKNIDFISNADPSPPKKNTKLPSQHSMLDQHQHASETHGVSLVGQ